VQFLARQDRYSLLQTHSSLRDATEDYCEATLGRIGNSHGVDDDWNTRIGDPTKCSAFECLSLGATNSYLYGLPVINQGYVIWTFSLSSTHFTEPHFFLPTWILLLTCLILGLDIRRRKRFLTWSCHLTIEFLILKFVAMVSILSC